MPADLQRKQRTPAELRADIERTRQQIQLSVSELRHQVRVATNARAWYRHNPAPFIGAAVALGFYLGYRR